MYWEREKNQSNISVWDAHYFHYHDGFLDGDFDRGSLVYRLFNHLFEAG